MDFTGNLLLSKEEDGNRQGNGKQVRVGNAHQRANSVQDKGETQDQFDLYAGDPGDQRQGLNSFNDIGDSRLLGQTVQREREMGGPFGPEHHQCKQDDQ